MACDTAKLGCSFSAPQCSALVLVRVPEQSLFKAVQWKALCKAINELFFPLPCLLYKSIV